MSEKTPFQMRQQFLNFLEIEKEIKLCLIGNDLVTAKLLFEQTNWKEQNIDISGRLWKVSTEASLSNEIKEWLTTLKPLEKALSSWSIDGDTFIGLFKYNTELFHYLSYVPEMPYADFLYSAILKSDLRADSDVPGLWKHLRKEVKARWFSDGDLSAFRVALSSNNHKAIHWILDEGEDWNGLAVALNFKLSQDFNEVVSVLKSLHSKGIKWEFIEKEIGTECTLKIRSAMEKDFFKESIPTALSSKKSIRI